MSRHIHSRIEPVDERIRVARAHDPLEREAERAAAGAPRGGMPVAPAADAGESVGRAWADELRRAAGFGGALGSGAAAVGPASGGANFGDVRIHADARADHLARGIDAAAFTHGRDIFFARGRFEPGTGAGQRLLAHEMAHVQQQARLGPSTSVVQRAPGQVAVPATAPNPQRPSSGPPSTWSDADLEAYLLWALDIQQRPPAALGLRDWRGYESGRTAEYIANSSAPTETPGDVIFSAAASEETRSATGTAVSDVSDTTSRGDHGSPQMTELSSRSVQFPAIYSTSDLVVRAHSHVSVLPGGAAMSKGDAVNFLFEHPSAARVEFIFERRVDLASRPNAVLSGVIYQRDAIQGQPSQDPIDAAYDGSVPPSPRDLIKLLRGVEPSVKVSTFRYSAKSGFSHRSLGDEP